jgi:hypothetical protein
MRKFIRIGLVALALLALAPNGSEACKQCFALQCHDDFPNGYYICEELSGGTGCASWNVCFDPP